MIRLDSHMRRFLLIVFALVLLTAIHVVVSVITAPPTPWSPDDFLVAVWWNKLDDVHRALRFKPQLASAPGEASY